MSDVITEDAAAKVNLTLKVRGRRSDGYHLLESLIVFARGVGDVVRLTPGAAAVSGEQPVETSGPFATAIIGENLTTRALSQLATAEPRLRLGSVVLEKRLPVAAGMGGGSADAAALLRAVRSANPQFVESVDWYGIAAALGADVPVCLLNQPAFVWGVGERITPVAGLPPLPVVLVNPQTEVPADKTAQVFRRLAAPKCAEEPDPPATLPAFADAAALAAHMAREGNDLAAPARAVVPAIGEVEAALAAIPGCLHVALSGAGPTVFAVLATAQEAEAAAARLQGERPDWWIRAAVLGA